MCDVNIMGYSANPWALSCVSGMCWRVRTVSVARFARSEGYRV